MVETNECTSLRCPLGGNESDAADPDRLSGRPVRSISTPRSVIRTTLLLALLPADLLAPRAAPLLAQSVVETLTPAVRLRPIVRTHRWWAGFAVPRSCPAGAS